MPFYKWIIDSKQQSSEVKERGYNEESENREADLNAIANKRMINAIQHLTQLVKIAGDIFDAIDKECRSVVQRTNSLKIKIQSCQDVVDNLNAKTVPVPVSSLSAFREIKSHFDSHHVEDGTPIFCTFPRPPEIERLRQLASGPSPPAFIPSYKITLEADGEQRTVSSSSSTTTHIYCQPLPVISNSSKKSSGNSSSSDSMTSQLKVPSSVVPIDVSGQQFSRMASFRRSLIHVDFFIRRKKKKDKRRNTVTEGDTNELKNVLHNIINERGQHTLVPNMIFERKNSKCEISNNSKLQDENKITDISSEEKNNNSKETCTDKDFKNCIKGDSNSEKRKKNISNGNVKLDLKNQNSEITKPSTVSKRKLKGHIPISTVSAAMSVAVEMRQLNGINKLEDQSSSGNWSYSSDHNSSDSENKSKSPEMNSEDSSNNYSRNRLKEMSSKPKRWNGQTSDLKEIEISSGTSSDNNTVNDDATSNTISAESDVFFISSDESDGESSDILEHNYGSSLSLSTVSNGSLNSLLSQTGTEMASSTGTLTSVGIEQLPTPPPSPVITSTTHDKTRSGNDSNSNIEIASTNQMHECLPITKIDLTKPSKKIKSSQKISKSSKTEKVDTRKNSGEGSKSIFTALVNMKTRTKEQNKVKSLDKSHGMQNKPLINMYGCSSPKTLKQIPIFIKENVSPVMENNARKSMQSFSSYQSVQENGVEQKRICHPGLQEKPNAGSTYSTCVKVDTTPEADNIEVPFKYSHKVTVTPIQRHTIHEKNSIVHCKRNLFPDHEDQRQISQSTGLHQNLNKLHYPPDKREMPMSYQHNKPQRPMTLQTGKPKSAARVLLDPEGRVLHCTNSLDRKPHHTFSVGRDAHTNSYRQADTVNHVEIMNQGNQMHGTYGAQIHSLQNVNTAYYATKMDEFNANQAIKNISSSCNTPNSNRLDFHEREEFQSYPCIHAKQSLSEIFRPHSKAENRSNVNANKHTLYPTEDLSIKGRSSQHSPTVIPPNPNISGLPSSEIMLTQHNVNLHSLKMEKLSMAVEGSDCNDSLNNAYTSLSPRSPLSEFQKPQQSTMSTEDLFAVIHNCKKRMNIKTNSDISLASSSSRSSSSSFRPVSSKGALAETGFLSPRNPTSNFENSRDRRSWADFRPINGTPGDRKSLASDRLGPTKPTSMHDFKMLLLQTRSNNQVPGPRKSAVEMLKVPASQDKTRINFSPVSSPQCFNSFSVQNSPSSELVIYNGHSTVPFKRNNRARSSLQSRYTMYPPIFEDCSEDSENTRDNLQNCSVKTIAKLEHGDNTLHYNVRDTCKNPMENLRHWL